MYIVGDCVVEFTAADIKKKRILLNCGTSSNSYSIAFGPIGIFFYFFPFTYYSNVKYACAYSNPMYDQNLESII